MTTAIVERGTFTIKAFVSRELTKATLHIDRLKEDIRSHLFEIAHIMATVKNNDMLKDEDYKDIAEWAKDCFGYEKSMVYNLVKIGSEYTVPVLNEKGKVIGYKSNLPTENGEDYSPTQVIKMLPAGHELATELSETGVVNPSMTAKEIEVAIKLATAPETLDEESDITDEDENDTGDIVETDEPETVTVNADLWNEIHSYLIGKKDKKAVKLVERIENEIVF